MSREVKFILVNNAEVKEVPEFDLAINVERWFRDSPSLRKVPLETEDVDATTEEKKPGPELPPIEWNDFDRSLDLTLAFQNLLLTIGEPIDASVKCSAHVYVIAILCDAIRFRRISTMMELTVDILRRRTGWSVVHEKLER